MEFTSLSPRKRRENIKGQTKNQIENQKGGIMQRETFDLGLLLAILLMLVLFLISGCQGVNRLTESGANHSKDQIVHPDVWTPEQPPRGQLAG